MKVYIAFVQFERLVLVEADFVKETEQYVIIENPKFLTRGHYIPNRLEKRLYSHFFSLGEAITHLEERYNSRIEQLQARIWAIANIRAYQKELRSNRNRGLPATQAMYRHLIQQAMDKHGIEPEEIEVERGQL